MTFLNRAARLTVNASLIALVAACGGGGGGSLGGGSTGGGSTGGGSTGGGSTGGGSTGGGSTTTNVSITAPDVTQVAVQTAPPINFANNPPANTSIFLLGGTAVQATSTTVSAAGFTGPNNTNTVRATVTGTVTSNGFQVPIFNFNIPSLGVTANNVHGDGTTVTTSNGGTFVSGVSVLNYTLLDAWTYTAPGGTSYVSIVATGYGTPAANIPSTGTATYSGSGVGAYFVPNGTTSVSSGGLTGNASVNVNFGSGAVSGSLTNMTAIPGGGGASTPWNNVTLTGTLFNSNANFAGNTGTTGAPANAGTAGFSSAATGVFTGSFTGPNAEEAGVNWSLTDSSALGGKTAFGAVALTKQ